MSLQIPLNKFLAGGLQMIPLVSSTCRLYPGAASSVGGFLQQIQISSVGSRRCISTGYLRLNYNKKRSSITSMSALKLSSQSLPQHDNKDINKEDISGVSGSGTGDQSAKEESVKEQVLEASLNHVNSQGWNVNAITYGATDLGLSPSIAGIFKDIDLVHFFLIKSNDALEGHLGGQASSTSPSSSKISVEEALLFRLSQVFPYAPRYSEAIVHLLTPQNAPQSTKLLLELADTIAHYSLGDSSTDTTWYIRRLNIARLYVESELCLVQDSSPDFTQTKDFVKRRLSTVSSSLDTPLLLPSPQSIRVGLTTLANLFRVNAPR